MVIRVQVPPERDRLALEDDDRCVCDSHDGRNYHDEPDEPDVHLHDGNPQQEEPDGDLEHACR